MPKLDERQPDSRIPTYMRLPIETREELKSVIHTVVDGREVESLTDAVIAAAKRLPKPKKARKQ